MANHIKTLLAPLLKKSKSDWKVKLLRNWAEIMGPMASNVTIVKVYEDTIILGVYDSSWLQELYLLSDMILQTINQSLDQPHIKQLRFKQVKRSATQGSKLSSPKKNIHDIPIALSSQEKKALDKIENENLRAVLKSFLIRCHRESKR